jgi:hypothetical protein
LSTDSDTLESVLQYLYNNRVTDDRIYSCVVPIDAAKLSFAVKRFTGIESASAANRAADKSQATWTTQKNRLKGKCYEKVMRILLPTGTTFTTWNRVQTTTNEIDILVGLGPQSKWFPLFNDWGTHFICECKSEKGHFSVSWVDKLFAILSTHNSHAGVILSKKAPSKTGNGRRALDKIRMLAILKKVILVLDMTDVQQCVQGTHILPLLQQRYIETTTGAANLSLL